VHNSRLKYGRSLLLASILILAPLTSYSAQETKKNLTTPVSESPAEMKDKNVMQKMDEDSLADKAGSDFKNGVSSLGGGFKKGAKVTGRSFKKAGSSVGHAFKKAGGAIKVFFAGKKEDSGVEEHDLSAPVERESPAQYNQNLDKVGNEPVKKTGTREVQKKSNDLAMGSDFKK